MLYFGRFSKLETSSSKSAYRRRTTYSSHSWAAIAALVIAFTSVGMSPVTAVSANQLDVGMAASGAILGTSAEEPTSEPAVSTALEFIDSNVVISSDGTAITAIWLQNNITRWGVHTWNSTDSGATWSAVRELSVPGIDSSNLQVSHSDDGTKITVLWLEMANDGWVVKARSSTNSGVTWGSVQNLSATGMYAYDPVLASSANGATVTAAWTGQDVDQKNKFVQTATSTNYGASWGQPQKLSNQWGSGAALAASGDGSPTVVWVEGTYGVGYSLKARSSKDAGATWEPVETIASANSYIWFPGVVASRDGTTLVAGWIRYASVGNFKADIGVNSGGAGWSTAELGSAYGYEEGPVATVSQDGGKIAVIWEGLGHSHYAVNVRTTADKGASWGQAQIVSPAGVDARGYELVAAQDGLALTAKWTGWNGTSYIVQSASSSNGGSAWSDAQDISEPRTVPETVELPSGLPDPETSTVEAKSLTTNEPVAVTAASLGGQITGSQLAQSSDGSKLAAIWNRKSGSQFVMQLTKSSDSGKTWSPVRSILLSALTTAGGGGGGGGGGGDVPTTSPRVAGADRYGTAVAISQEAFPSGGVPVAYVATGGDFPDALAGAAAASAAGGPLLLVGTDSMPAGTASELSRLKPARIVVLGGSSSVSDGVVTALRSYAPSVTRAAGSDRYSTAVVAAHAFTGTGGNVILATGGTFADSLSAGSLFGSYGGPILLVQPNSGLSAAVKGELARLAPSRIFILGGTGSVSAQAEREASSYGTVVRLAGADRYATSAAIADWVSANSGFIGASIAATGALFPDGLAAGVLAGHRQAPLLLSNGTCWSSEAKVTLNRIAGAITLIGGPATLADTVGAGKSCG